MKDFKLFFRIIRISIFVFHTVWVFYSIVNVFKAETLKGGEIVPYIYTIGAFLASYILFSMLYEKTVPAKKRSDKLLSRFVYMFETMLITSGILVISFIVKSAFLS